MLNKEIISNEKGNIVYEVTNSREFIVYSTTVIFRVESINDYFNTIISIKFDEKEISLFDEISLPIDAEIRSIYKVKKIEQISKNTFKITTDPLNKTSNFLLPLLINNNLTKDFFLYDTYFYNAYISNDFKFIVLRYRYSESTLYQSFEKRIKSHPQYYKTRDLKFNFVDIIFNIPPGDYLIPRLFFEGKYSKFPDKFKKNIMDFYSYKTDGAMYGILYKTSNRRKQLELEFDIQINAINELYDIPVKEEEIITIRSN